MPKNPELSAHKLPLFRRCPEMFQFRHVIGRWLHRNASRGLPLVLTQRQATRLRTMIQLSRHDLPRQGIK